MFSKLIKIITMFQNLISFYSVKWTTEYYNAVDNNLCLTLWCYATDGSNNCVSTDGN